MCVVESNFSAADRPERSEYSSLTSSFAAEDNEMIWAVTLAALTVVADWYRKEFMDTELTGRISVNLSPKQICRSDAAPIILELIERSGAAGVAGPGDHREWHHGRH